MSQRNRSRFRRHWFLCLFMGGLGLLSSAPLVLAQDADEGSDQEAPAKEVSQKKDDGKTPELPDIGVRFTPRMAEAISKQMTRQMKKRYELDDAQIESIQGILERQLTKVVAENAETGRNLIEKMTATMIENDGQMPKDVAQDFAKEIKPLIPAIKGFFTESSTQISKQMSVKQRLKFTGDMAGVTAGFAIFEDRMKRWEEGKVSANANPFYDPADRDPAKAEEKVDPTENEEHRRARQNVERWIDWQIDLDRNWEQYVNRAIEYYEFNEKQNNAAKTILKECLDRAKSIKTDEWRQNIKENRVAQQLSWGLKGDYGVGPWQHRLESEYERLLKPMKDLDLELKKRIDALPDSKQRAAADGNVKKLLTEKGMKRIPV